MATLKQTDVSDVKEALRGIFDNISIIRACGLELFETSYHAGTWLKPYPLAIGWVKGIQYLCDFKSNWVSPIVTPIWQRFETRVEEYSTLRRDPKPYISKAVMEDPLKLTKGLIRLLYLIEREGKTKISSEDLKKCGLTKEEFKALYKDKVIRAYLLKKMGKK